MFISILYMFQAAMCPSSGELYQYDIFTEWYIPDVVLIQLILLMMGTWLPETC